MQSDTLTGGFTDAPTEAAEAFRHIMRAMACPGEIREVADLTPPAGLSAATATLLLTLCDHETPVYLAASCNTDAVRSWITFHTNAPFAEPADAMFACGTWEELRGLEYPLGTAEYPDRSTTLIVELPELNATGATLRGPGIKETASLSLPEQVFFQENALHFPRGLDFFFTSGSRLAGLPRSTKVS